VCVYCIKLLNHTSSIRTKTTMILQRLNSRFTSVYTYWYPLQGSPQNGCDYLASLELKPCNFFYPITSLIWFPVISVLNYLLVYQNQVSTKSSEKWCSFLPLYCTTLMLSWQDYQHQRKTFRIWSVCFLICCLKELMDDCVILFIYYTSVVYLLVLSVAQTYSIKW
jgi:hypothetical protein